MTREEEEIKQLMENGICREMEGKMKGMMSFSTSCTQNPFSQRQKEIPGSICQKCYAQSLLAMREGLENKGIRNAELVTKKVLPEECLPTTMNCLFFRFEAFGDLHNIIHLTNYVNIAKKNPLTRFTLFTKNYKLLYEFFSANKCPDNMTIVYSSLFINKTSPIDKLLPLFKPGQLKVFTVNSYDYIKDHPEVKINCGGRTCLDCKRCYGMTDDVYINEILKSDKEKAEKLIDLREKGLEAVFSKFDGLSF